MFQKHMLEGIAWALGRFDAPAAPNADVQAAEYLRSVVAATGLRPMLLELRALKPEDRAAGYAKVIAEIEKP
jgi:hypothetical protein